MARCNGFFNAPLRCSFKYLTHPRRTARDAVASGKSMTRASARAAKKHGKGAVMMGKSMAGAVDRMTDKVAHRTTQAVVNTGKTLHSMGSWVVRNGEPTPQSIGFRRPGY